MQLGRRYRFAASHRLHSPGLTDAENREIFGKCNNPYGHGHDYILELIVEGDPDPATGLLLHVPSLDRLVRDSVLSAYDHRYLNEEIAAFRDLPPTTENVALDIRRRLGARWSEASPGRATLRAVRVYETRRNMVEVG